MLKVQLLMCETPENEIALIPLNPFCARIQLDAVSNYKNVSITPGPTKCKSAKHYLLLGNVIINNI